MILMTPRADDHLPPARGEEDAVLKDQFTVTLTVVVAGATLGAVPKIVTT